MVLARCSFLLLAVLGLTLVFAGPSARAEEAKVVAIPVILDTDIGTDIDDAFALALVLASPELDLRGITTVNGDTLARARIACRLLHAAGRNKVPVAAGKGQPGKAQGQFKYGAEKPVKGEPAAPLKETAVEFLYRQLKAEPGKITLITVGDLTNIADLLEAHPDCKPWIPRIVLMGGAVRVGYSHKPPVEVEWNIKQDIGAARKVFAAGIPLVVAPLDATTHLKLEEKQRAKLFAAETPLTQELALLLPLWEGKTPVLYDPVAVRLAFDETFCKVEPLRLEVDAEGFTREVAGPANARVALANDRETFLDWYVERVAAASRGVKE